MTVLKLGTQWLRNSLESAVSSGVPLTTHLAHTTRETRWNPLRHPTSAAVGLFTNVRTM